MPRQRQRNARDLPLAGAERADAARNRRRVLKAAARLFEEHGADNVTMEQVARAAGVAKGTVFHRFGNRSGLALALLDEHERALQEEVLRGRPPLGPGAPPAERLVAFTRALLDLLEEHGDLLFVSETAKAGARYRTGAYDAWHRHAAVLIAEARPDADADALAHVVLAPFAAELHRHVRGERGIGVKRLRAALAELARAVTRA